MKKIKTNYKRNLLDSPGLRRGDHILVHGHSVDLPEAAHQAGHLFVVAVAVVVVVVVVTAAVADGVVGVEDLHHAGVQRRHQQDVLPPGQERGVRGEGEPEHQ